jgi:hypothetical protein
LEDETGQTTAEYVTFIVLVAPAVFILSPNIKDATLTVFLNPSSALELRRYRQSVSKGLLMSPILWLCCNGPVRQGCTDCCVLLARQGRADTQQSSVVCPLVDSSHNHVIPLDASAAHSPDPWEQVGVYSLASKRTSQVLKTFDRRIFPTADPRREIVLILPPALNVRIIYTKSDTDIS